MAYQIEISLLIEQISIESNITFSLVFFFSLSCFNLIAVNQSDNTHITTAERQTNDKKNYIAKKSIILGAGAGLWYNNKTSKFIYANESKREREKNLEII